MKTIRRKNYFFQMWLVLSSATGIYLVFFNAVGFGYGMLIYLSAIPDAFSSDLLKIYNEPRSPISSFLLRVIALYILTKLSVLLLQGIKHTEELKEYGKLRLTFTILASIVVMKSAVTICLILTNTHHLTVSIFWLELSIVIGPYPYDPYGLDSYSIFLNLCFGIACLIPAYILMLYSKCNRPRSKKQNL